MDTKLSIIEKGPYKGWEIRCVPLSGLIPLARQGYRQVRLYIESLTESQKVERSFNGNKCKWPRLETDSWGKHCSWPGDKPEKEPKPEKVIAPVKSKPEKRKQVKPMGSAACTKTSYPSMKSTNAGRTGPRHILKAYKCPHCPYFHLTSKLYGIR